MSESKRGILDGAVDPSSGVSKRRHLVAICGNSGVGKTTLTRLLAQRLGWRMFIEPADANPYLEEFLEDMGSWGLHVQLYYLARHLRDARLIDSDSNSAVRDRSFYEGAEIYARNLRRDGKLSERDWRLYRSLYDAILPQLPVPSLLIFLRAGAPFLNSRVQERGRRNEESLTADLLAKTNDLYDEWINSFTLCPVLRVQAEDFDFLNSSSDLDQLIHGIDLRLQGGFADRTT